MVALGVVYASTPRALAAASPGAPVAAASPVNPANVQSLDAPCVPTLWVVDSGKFFSVDLATGASTFVAPLDPDYPSITNLRFAPDGTLYGYQFESYPKPGRRLRVDVVTGAVTDIGPGFDREITSGGTELNWFPPGYLPEGSGAIGIQMDQSNLPGAFVPRNGTLRTIHALEPYQPVAESPLSPRLRRERPSPMGSGR